MTPEEAIRQRGGTREHYKPSGAGAQQANGSSPPRGEMFGRLRVLQLADVLAAPPRDYLVKDLFYPAEMSVVWGQPKSGKSFLMMHLTLALAQGRPVFGRRVHPAPVLYVLAEGESGIPNRARALTDEYGPSPKFHLIAQRADLLHKDGDLPSLIDATRACGARIVVLDTLSRLLAGGDENGPIDMGTFVRNCDELREATRAHVALIHHGSKSDNPSARGHTSLIGAADLVMRVEKHADGARSATVMDARDMAEGGAFDFRLRVVDLGGDADGDAVTTCLVEETTAKPTRNRLTVTERNALNYLAEVLLDCGTPLPAGPNYPAGLKGAPETAWREACDSRRLSTAETKESRSKTFKRVYQNLLDKGAVGTRDGTVWITHPEAT